LRPCWPGGSLYGERYYFETFFALAILGAVGWSALESRWVIPLAAKRNLAIGLLVVQAFHYAFFVEEAYSQLTPYTSIAAKASQLGPEASVVFLTSGPNFTARDMNLNSAEWRSSTAFYAEDPGPVRRLDMACALGRSRWIVLRYNERSGVVRVDESGRVQVCPGPW